MGRYIPYNGNPAKNRVGDCTVRAISKALSDSWGLTYVALCVYGFMAYNMPTANTVWGAYLRARGFRRHLVDRDENYTVEDFAIDNPCGVYVLALSEHVVAVVGGFYYDTWDCGDETPIYYWTREE